VSARVGQEHADLGVLDAAGGAGVLALDTDAVDAFLQVAGLVDHQNAVGVAEPVDHHLAYVVADDVGVPCRPVEQSLHRVRTVMPGMLGQLPARLDLEVGEQAGDERGRRPPRLDPGEPARETIEFQG
jgi:hypothetical protein